MIWGSSRDSIRASDKIVATCLVMFATMASSAVAQEAAKEKPGSGFLSNIRQVTFEGRRSGEGYFSADGSKMIFQSERDPANPFYQIFVLDLNTGDTTPVSPGMGKTTCAWLHPNGKGALFASTHDDPNSLALQKAELELRASGKTKRYSWDYDEHYEIYATELGSNKYTNLTKTRGYDAEGSYSSDGKWVAFASNRHAYTDKLSAEDQQLLTNDAKYFLDIYIMRADGSDVKRLTNVPGYDGGPFFSPDSKRICWRRFTPDGNIAEIWTMNIDGSDQKQITKLGGMSWAPYYHPSGDYLIFTTDINGRSNFELYIVDVEGKHEPVRVSNLPGFDGLPVFFPDGKRIAWTANRTGNKKGQIYFADFDHRQAQDSLEIARPSDSLEGHARNRALIHEATSPAITQMDHHLRESVIEAEVDPSKRAFGLFVAYTEFMKELGFSPPKIFEDPEGNVSVSVDSTFGNPRDSEVVLLFLEIKARGNSEWLRRSIRDLAALIEFAQFFAHQTQHAESSLVRPLRIVVAFTNSSAGINTRRRMIDQAIKDSNCSAALFTSFDGLPNKPSRLLIEGTGTSQLWPRLVERANLPIGLSLAIDAAPSPESAVFLLYENEIPVLSILPVSDGGQQPLRNGHSSTPDLKPVEFVSRILERLAVQPKAPVFTPITKRADAAKGRPYLGTEPDYRARVEGVLLKGVKENGPAHAGGMRAGDVIVQMGDTPIAGVQAYADALDTLSAGETILVVVMRDGERVLLRVTVGEREQ